MGGRRRRGREPVARRGLGAEVVAAVVGGRRSLGDPTRLGRCCGVDAVSHNVARRGERQSRGRGRCCVRCCQRRFDGGCGAWGRRGGRRGGSRGRRRRGGRGCCVRAGEGGEGVGARPLNGRAPSCR
jgi:hypothetical protein